MEQLQLSTIIDKNSDVNRLAIAKMKLFTKLAKISKHEYSKYLLC